MKPKKVSLPVFLAVMLSATAGHAASVIALNNFESSLGAWTAAGGSSGRYVHQTTLQPADDTTTNFATGTSGTNFTTGGTGAASVGKGGGTLTSSIVNLSSGGASETLTINLDFVWHNGSSTRRAFVDYSNDGGTTWFSLAMMQIGSTGASTNKVSYSGSVTLTEGSSTVSRSGSFGAPNLGSNAGAIAYNGASFSSSSIFRVKNNASAGADARLFIDNLEVVSSIPEPRAALLGGLGLLMLLRRRR